MVFRAGDVGQDGVIVAFLDQTHGDAGDRTFQLNAGVIEGEACAAHRCHGRRTVRLQDVGDDANRIWRLFGAWQHGRNGALGQRAVAHFAAAYAGHAAGFANAEGWKVVMQHEVLLLLAFIGLEPLPIVGCAQSSRNQSLRLAACKQG